MIETRNGSGLLLQQYVWTASRATASTPWHRWRSARRRAWMRTRCSRVRENCEDFYYALQDQQYNVLAFTDEGLSVNEI